jgi:hypothetical protein
MKRLLVVLVAILAAVAMAPADLLAGNSVTCAGGKVSYTVELQFISNTPGKRNMDPATWEGKTVSSFSASFDDPVATGTVKSGRVSFTENATNDRERRFFRIQGIPGFEWAIPADDGWMVARQSQGRVDSSAPINWRKIGLEWMPGCKEVPDGAEWNPWDNGAVK